MSRNSQSETNRTIDIQPQHSIETPYDREDIVMVKIPSTMLGNIDSATDKLVVAITDIFTSQVVIDHIEFFCWNVADGIVIAIAGHSPKVQNTTQPRVDQVADAGEDLSEPLATVFHKLNQQLPDALDLKIGTLPFGMFGTEPGVTARAVMPNKNQKITNRSKIDNAGLSALIRDLKDEPFVYSCIIRRPGGLAESFEFQVTARVAVFDPQYRVSSKREYAKTVEYGRKLDPMDAFKSAGASSTLEQVDQQYRLLGSANSALLYPKENSPLEHFAADRDLITGDSEYEHLLHGRYGASDSLEEICSYTSLMIRQSDLGLFVGIETAAPNGDPWANAAVGNPRDIDTLATDLSTLTPEPVSISVDAYADSDIDRTTPSTANDGARRHWEAIKQTALALKTDGYDVVIVEQDTGSRPDLWARGDDGEIFAVEVESTTRSKAGSFFTNLIRQALWGYKTIVVMVPQTDSAGRTQSLQTVGDWAVTQLAKPMKELDEQKTKLHNLSENIVKNGQTILLPEGVTESEWWLTCENEYFLLSDGDVLAKGDATAPFDAFEFETPRYYEDEGRWIVEDHDGTRLQTCQSESDIAYTRASPCHRPVDLSYVRFVEALYCYDPEASELVQHDIVAKWDQADHSARHEASHEDAFTTFVVDREDGVLWEHECRPFIREWIGNLSNHGSPAKNIYGQYRNNYYERKSKNVEVGKEHHYPNATFRYERGLVSPDLPGLNTTPSFPADWVGDTDDALREPLIYGLDDRNEVPEASEGDSQ